MRPSLTDLRAFIDGIDEDIAGLLRRREALAREVSELKGGAIFSAVREEEILAASSHPDVTAAILRASKVAQVAATLPRTSSCPVLGPGGFALVAGPCSAETEEQVEEVATALAAAGVKRMRAGVWKPRTSPAAFQGVGEPALRWLRDSADRHGLEVWTEVRDVRNIATTTGWVDVAWVGARNCQNFELLRAVGVSFPRVVLKRGAGVTVEEWLGAAEYIAAGGAKVALCERGVRTFDPAFRNLLDLAGAVWAKRLSGLEVLVDPSHGTGLPALIHPMVLAAKAAGLDGAIVEAHPRPAESVTDAAQAVSLRDVAALVSALEPGDPSGG